MGNLASSEPSDDHSSTPSFVKQTESSNVASLSDDSLQQHKVIWLSNEDYVKPITNPNITALATSLEDDYEVDRKNRQNKTPYIRQIEKEPYNPDGTINWRCTCNTYGSIIAGPCGYEARDLISFENSRRNKLVEMTDDEADYIYLDKLTKLGICMEKYPTLFPPIKDPDPDDDEDDDDDDSSEEGENIVTSQRNSEVINTKTAKAN